MADDCLFCKIVKREIEPAVVYENAYVLAILDINPAGELSGHTVVIIKKHFPNVSAANEKDLCEAIKAVKKIIPALTKVSGADAVNIIENDGKAAGQLVPHAHFHIIPRKHGDGIRLDENRRQPKPLELTETAKAIKDALKQHLSS